METSTEHQIKSILGRIETLEKSLDSLRSDLIKVALAVGAGPRAENA